MAELNITSIQSNLYWENKADNLRMFSQKIELLPAHAEVVILPEMFATGFTMNPQPFAETMEGDTVKWMQQTAAENKIILTGSVIIKEGDLFYNRLIWMLPNGELGFYDKRHLFAFAGENEKYRAGHKRLIASVKGWKINLQICYDLRFPVWARQQTKDPEYDILIYVANWPERRSHAWKTLLCARAIENQCYVIGVNRVGKDGNGIYHSGNSMMINPLGEVLYHMSDDEDIFTLTLLKEDLEKVREKFPFYRDADSFSIRDEDII
ncbi:MAG: amidohydrolase [Niastella sp. SCN 39-18]|nr:amidohydrolase [Sphingobacteriales bacterium]ODT52672.1 MAG: amidohydrolase [Niastella sp. SCN 39-18]OJW11811.1 MAG: nitrilase family protein [Sphingobacteriales bacterium 39-19]